MNTNSFHSFRMAAAVGAAMMLLIGCASKPPAPIARESVTRVEATVVEIQSAKRLVSLRRPDGQTVTLELGPEVRNFDQIHVGDRVIASYHQSMGFGVVDPRAPQTADSGGVIAGRAALGDRPAGAIGGFVEATVTIVSVDTTAHTVTFTGEDGLVRTIPVEREDGRAFAARLRRGDRVVMTYAEAVAISVEHGE